MPRTPNYQRVYDDIVRRIESGELAPGDPLPSMANLMREYGVGNNAVRHAILLLRERGYVDSHQGKAIWVRERHGET